MTGPHEEKSQGRRFHLLERIGEGAFGEVYLADMETDTGFRRRVAIKLLRDELKVPAAAQRMRDEARILGRLSHRNVVTVLDLVRLGDRTAIVMEHVPGADLEQVVAALGHCRERFPVRAALEAAAAVASALEAAWTARDADGAALAVVHRDIKPSNLRLSPDGVIKVLDFGVATFTHPSREALTMTSAWVGTERYMAPERILCEGEGPGGDVYALAATLVELIQGRPLGRSPVLPERHVPFVQTALEALRARTEIEEPAIAEAVERTLQGALASTPPERPTARELAAVWVSLADAASGESLASFATRFVPRVAELIRSDAYPASGVLVESDGLAGPPTLAAQPATSGRSSLAPLAMVGAAAGTGVLGVLVGGVLLLGGGFYLGLALRSAPSPTPVAAAPPSAPLADPRSTTPPPAPPTALVEGTPSPSLAPGVGAAGPSPALAPALVALPSLDPGSAPTAAARGPVPALTSTPDPMSAVAGAPAPVSAVAGAPDPVSAVAGAPAPMSAVAGAPDPVSAVAGAPDPVSAVAGAPDPVSAVAGAPDPVSAVAGAPAPMSAVAAAPAPSPAVAGASAPVSAVAGAPAPAALPLTGNWAGKAGGRPFELRLTDTGGRVTAEAVFVLGAVSRAESLAGGFDGRVLTLQNADGKVRFDGVLGPGGLEGTYATEGGKRLSWSVSR